MLYPDIRFSQTGLHEMANDSRQDDDRLHIRLRRKRQQDIGSSVNSLGSKTLSSNNK